MQRLAITELMSRCPRGISARILVRRRYVVASDDSTCAIPVIDLRKLFDPESSEEECAKLGSACLNWGFFQVHICIDIHSRSMCSSLLDKGKDRLHPGCLKVRRPTSASLASCRRRRRLDHLGSQSSWKRCRACRWRDKRRAGEIHSERHRRRYPEELAHTRGAGLRGDLRRPAAAVPRVAVGRRRPEGTPTPAPSATEGFLDAHTASSRCSVGISG